MKIAKAFAWFLGILAMALMVFSIGLCLVSLNTHVELSEVPDGAAECAENVMEAVASGDFTGASRYFYGQPDLGTDRQPGEMEGGMIYEAFRNSLSYAWDGDFFAADTGIARNVTVTYLDIPSVTEQLDQRVREARNARVETAEDPAQLYDETYQLREDVAADVLTEALVRCLAEDAKMTKQTLVLNLVYRDGQWWALLDGAMLQVLTGGRA